MDAGATPQHEMAQRLTGGHHDEQGDSIAAAAPATSKETLWRQQHTATVAAAVTPTDTATVTAAVTPTDTTTVTTAVTSAETVL